MSVSSDDCSDDTLATFSLDDEVDYCVYASQFMASRDTDSIGLEDEYGQFFLDANMHETTGPSDNKAQGTTERTKPRRTLPREPNYQRLRPMFGWASTDVIKKMFQLTTQYTRLPVGTLERATPRGTCGMSYCLR